MKSVIDGRESSRVRNVIYERKKRTFIHSEVRTCEDLHSTWWYFGEMNRRRKKMSPALELSSTAVNKHLRVVSRRIERHDRSTYFDVYTYYLYLLTYTYLYMYITPFTSIWQFVRLKMSNFAFVRDFPSDIFNNNLWDSIWIINGIVEFTVSHLV